MAGSLRVAAAGQVSHQGLTDLRGQRESVVAASPLPRTTSSPARQSTSCSSRRATSIERRPSRAISVMIAKLRMPTGLPRSQLSSSRWTSAAVMVGGGRVAKRHPPTGGTAVPSGSGVMPCRYKNLRIERSSATRPLADPAETRPHSRSRKALMSTPVSAAGSNTPAADACSCRKRRAVFSYRSTVIAARPRSPTIQHRYCPSSAPNGVTGGCSAATTPVSRR
jgi:hypothetical protein